MSIDMVESQWKERRPKTGFKTLKHKGSFLSFSNWKRMRDLFHTLKSYRLCNYIIKKNKANKIQNIWPPQQNTCTHAPSLNIVRIKRKSNFVDLFWNVIHRQSAFDERFETENADNHMTLTYWKNKGDCSYLFAYNTFSLSVLSFHGNASYIHFVEIHESFHCRAKKKDTLCMRFSFFHVIP